MEKKIILDRPDLIRGTFQRRENRKDHFCWTEKNKQLCCELLMGPQSKDGTRVLGPSSCRCTPRLRGERGKVPWQKRPASCLQRMITSCLRQFDTNREHPLSYWLEATETMAERPRGVAEQQVENHGMRQVQPPEVPAGVTQWWRHTGKRTPAATPASAGSINQRWSEHFG